MGAQSCSLASWNVSAQVPAARLSRCPPSSGRPCRCWTARPSPPLLVLFVLTCLVHHGAGRRTRSARVERSGAAMGPRGGRHLEEVEERQEVVEEAPAALQAEPREEGPGEQQAWGGRGGGQEGGKEGRRSKEGQGRGGEEGQGGGQEGRGRGRGWGEGWGGRGV